MDSCGRALGGALLVFGEETAELRLHAERRKRLGADRLAADAFGRCTGVGAEVGVVAHRRAHLRERSVLVAPGEVVGDAGVCFLRRVVERIRAQHDHPFVARDGQAFTHDHVEDTEDRGVRADAQRQRCQCHDREARIAAQHACAVDHVLSQIVDPADRARVADLFLEQRDIADGATCGEAGVSL